MDKGQRDLVERMMPHLNSSEDDRKAAWNEMLSASCRKIESYIRSFNRTSTPHEDILQDAVVFTYVKVERGELEFSFDIQVPAYIKRVAYYKILEAGRRGSRFVSIENGVNASTNNNRELETKIVKEETYAKVWSTLKAMSDTQFEIFRLSYIEGLSTAEIATALGLKEGNIRVIKSRTTKALESLVDLD